MGKLNQAMTDLLRYNAAIQQQKRSVFNKSHSHATCLDSAWLVPIMWDRVLPGDEKKIRYSGLARMATPIHPTMDEAFLDTWAFFVPDRLWWNHAREFYGENKDASFNPDGEYVMPFLTPSRYAVDGDNSYGLLNPNGIGGLNDYFGFPVMFAPSRFDDYPEYFATAGLHRCYQLIWDEYYRNSSVQPALELNDGDTVTDAEWEVINKMRRVNKLPDYFTTCLLTPQAGDDVLLPLNGWAPVVTRSEEVPPSMVESSINGQFLKLGEPGIDWIYDPTAQGLGVAGTTGVVTATDDSVTLNPLAKYSPSNLWANLQSATATTINDLRAAITVQQFLEISAIGGKRYQQILRAHFGTFVPDATIQRPLLLGATRTSIGMRQVLQTSAQMDGSTPQGNAAAVSVTNVANEWICNHAFVEPGFIMVLAAVRPIHSYSQGLDPLLTKLQTYDHYWPVFDNIGNQPVYSKELYLSPKSLMEIDPEEYKDRVFGYKPAWTEYKMKQNRVSGLFRPDVNGSLDSWNYTSEFIEPQLLSDEFVREDENLIDRTIAVPSEPQFLLDSYFEYTDIKSMSVHSTPGLTRL